MGETPLFRIAAQFKEFKYKINFLFSYKNRCDSKQDFFFRNMIEIPGGNRLYFRLRNSEFY